jgi:hypothetical protein
VNLRGVKRAVFARHCNPWSAWTRWASVPLVLVPVWRRSWRDAALVGAWMAVNPVVFGKPAHERAWSTRAMLGEEKWISERPMDAAMAVNAAATAAGIGAMIAARQRRAVPAAVATAASMALLLVYWELMARYHDRHGQHVAEHLGCPAVLALPIPMLFIGFGSMSGAEPAATVLTAVRRAGVRAVTDTAVAAAADRLGQLIRVEDGLGEAVRHLENIAGEP